MASSSTSTSVTTQTTVYLPNILLDETNYPSWLFRLEAFLKGQNLYGYVDGTIPCPPQLIRSSDGTTVINPEYDAWKTQDQSVVNMIGQTLTPVATNCAVGSRSAHELWKNLKHKFAASNRQNIVQLKTNLQNLRKGSDNIETYLDRIKAARDALETVGVFLDDEDIVVTVLRGLPSEFAAIKTVIRAQYDSSSLPELKSLLQAAEVDIELETQGNHLPLTAMMAKNSSPTTTVTQASSSQSPSMSNASSQASVSTTPSMPPGFGAMPSSSQASYIPLPALPYGFGQLNPYAMLESAFGMNGMTGLYAGRGIGDGRNNSFHQNNRGNHNNYPHNNTYPRRFGVNNNAGNGNGFIRNNNGNSLTCQLCHKVGHGAKTCKSLSNYMKGNSSSDICCQYCGKDNHTADRCFFIIGFPNQQQQHASANASALVAAANYAPQYWLADTGATNHMTNDAQMLSNITSVSNSDSVQFGNGDHLSVTHFGQGDGHNTVQRTE